MILFGFWFRGILYTTLYVNDKLIKKSVATYRQWNFPKILASCKNFFFIEESDRPAYSLSFLSWGHFQWVHVTHHMTLRSRKKISFRKPVMLYMHHSNNSLETHAESVKLRYFTDWYHLCNLKSIANTRGRVLLLVKLQPSVLNITKSS